MSITAEHKVDGKSGTEKVNGLPEPVFEQVLLSVRLRARRRIAWLRKVWSTRKEIYNNANGNALNQELEIYLNNADDPVVEFEWYASETSLKELNSAIRETEELLLKNGPSRLNRLKDIFLLNEVERDVLHSCLALSLDNNLNRVFAFLNNNSNLAYVTENLVARLYGHGRYLALSSGSNLKLWGLIQDRPIGNDAPNSLRCDPFIRNWLLNIETIDGQLRNVINTIPVREPLDCWPVKETVEWIKHLLERPGPVRSRIMITGSRHSGRSTFAACVARHFGLSVLKINSDLIKDADWNSSFTRIQRQAFLNPSALVWTGNKVKQLPWPTLLPFFQLQFVTGTEKDGISSTKNIIEYQVDLPAPDSEERRGLWLDLVPSAKNWPKNHLDALVNRQQISIGHIANMAKRQIETVEEATRTINTKARQKLGNLAQHLKSDFNWDDLVLNSWLRQQLEDFSFEAKERIKMWEKPEARRLFPQGRGLLSLFSGPPGTGKTMAAQVIANSLKMDLYRVDLSTMVSKYVGETSKNIERILSKTQDMDAIILFDEADALFGKRTEIKDAHDRFANTDTNYLLQAIEQYPGIAILASNRKANIDTGFTRRLRYVMEFQKPDVAQRLELWNRTVAALAGHSSRSELENDLKRFAEILELTGAQIKYAVLSGIYQSRKVRSPLQLNHLLYGVRQELLKEGRGLTRQAQELLK